MNLNQYLNRTNAKIAAVYSALGVGASTVALKVAHLQAGQWITALLWFGAAVSVFAVAPAAISTVVRRCSRQNPVNAARPHEHHEEEPDQ